MSAVDELERLDDEFNFPDSAGPQFHVQILGRDFALDAPFKGRDFIEQLGRGTSRKNEWLMMGQKLVSEFFAPAYAAGFDQGEPLPCFTKTSVVIVHALKRARERTSRSFRPQAEIDAKQCPGRIAGGKDLQNRFRQSIMPFVFR